MSQQLLPLSREVERFLGMIEKFADMLDSAQFSLVAYRLGDKWTSLSTLLKVGGTTGPETILNVHGKLLVLSASVEVSSLRSMLTRATQEQQIQLSGYDIHLTPSEPFRLQKNVERPYLYGTPYDPGPNSVVLLSSMNGNTIGSVVPQGQSQFDSIDEILQSFDPPYLNLADLAESHLGYPLGPAYMVNFFGLLLLPFKVLAADIGAGRKLQVKLSRDPRINRGDVVFGVVVKPEAGVPIRVSTSLTTAETLSEEKNIETLRLNLSVPQSAGTVIRLSVKDEALSTTTLYPGMSSPRLRCHRLLNPDEALLEKALTERGGRPFEEAIAMLLHLGGFKVEDASVLESLASDRFADILAFTPDEQTIVIGACVFKNPSPQDVTLLAQSYLSTKSALFDPQLTIMPILFTSIPKDTVSTSLQEQAHREQIQVVTREQLLQALGLVKSGAGPPEILKEFGHWSGWW